MVNLRTQKRSGSLIPFVSRLNQGSDDMGNLVRRFLGDDLATEFFAQPVSWLPPVEVTESDKSIVISAELPGLAEKDVELSLEDDVLTIRGEKMEEKKEEKDDKRYHVVERTYGSFRRSFSLPSNVDAEKATAEFSKGVLTVTLPKVEAEKQTGRKIPVVTK